MWLIALQRQSESYIRHILCRCILKNWNTNYINIVTNSTQQLDSMLTIL